MIKWNLKARAKNKVFWIALIPAILLFIQSIFSVFGVHIDLTELGDKLIAVVEAAFIVLTILGVVTDPTTKGLSDSNKAMTYTEPQ